MKGYVLSILYILLAIILPVGKMFGAFTFSWAVALAPIWIPLLFSWIVSIFIIFVITLMIVIENRKWR